MLNRRTVSRYHLVHPLTGYIEHGGTRFLGEVVEFSTGGFRLVLRDTAREALTFGQGDFEFGEVIYQQDEIGGFGEIRYVRTKGSDLWIGFKWDDFHATENIQKSFAIIAELVSKSIAGCVNISNDVVQLAGHVSEVLFEDVQQCIEQGLTRVSLKECTSIDDSGIDMLAALEDIHLELEDLSAEISALLQEHRLQKKEAIHSDYSVTLM